MVGLLESAGVLACMHHLKAVGNDGADRMAEASALVRWHRDHRRQKHTSFAGPPPPRLSRRLFAELAAAPPPIQTHDCGSRQYIDPEKRERNILFTRP